MPCEFERGSIQEAIVRHRLGEKRLDILPERGIVTTGVEKKPVPLTRGPGTRRVIERLDALPAF